MNRQNSLLSGSFQSSGKRQMERNRMPGSKYSDKEGRKRREGEGKGAGKGLVLSKADLLTQQFSNSSKCQNYREGLLKQRF